MRVASTLVVLQISWCCVCHRARPTLDGGRRLVWHDHSLGLGEALACPRSSTISQGHRSPICSPVYATGPGPPLMAAGGLSGVITVWDLEKRRLATIIRDAHDGSVTKLHFFPGEPVLMSAAADNSIKHWIFDGADGAARLLRFRSGHASPPSVLRFYGDGLRILSAGANLMCQFVDGWSMYNRSACALHQRSRSCALYNLESSSKCKINTWSGTVKAWSA